MSELELLQTERQALREEVRRLEMMNEALVDAGEAVVSERNSLRVALRRIRDVELPDCWPEELSTRMQTLAAETLAAYAEVEA